MPKFLLFDAFMLLILKKNVANYALLLCETYSLKIWLCKILDKYHMGLNACVHDAFGNVSSIFLGLMETSYIFLDLSKWTY